MAKYSIDSSNDGKSNSCELCGKSNTSLEKAVVEKATLEVCSECISFNDSDTRGNNKNENREKNKNPVKKSSNNKSDTVKTGYTITSLDNDWVEESRPTYNEDSVSYLVSNYSNKVEKKRKEKRLMQDELADKSNVDKEVIVALENGKAIREDLKKSSVKKVENILDIEIIDDF